MTTNEMTLAKAFSDAGIEQEKAEGLAQIIFDAIRDNKATKADLRDAVNQITTTFRDAEHHFTANLRNNKDLRKAVRQLTIRGVGALVIGIAALFAALHQWPPHWGG